MQSVQSVQSAIFSPSCFNDTGPEVGGDVRSTLAHFIACVVQKHELDPNTNAICGGKQYWDAANWCGYLINLYKKQAQRLF